MPQKTPKIIFEDDYILILEKPAGLVVNRAKTVKEKSLQDWVEEKLKIKNEKLKIPSEFVRRSGIVHRLDKETSGLLLIAKTPKVFLNLQKQFKERKVKKKYISLVHGKLEPGEGEIRLPIGRLPWDREKFGIRVDGRKAVTKYKVIKYLNNYSLLEVEPLTGRTHQIRVHLKALGHPIVGDKKYLGRKRARSDQKWSPRQFLHASYLSFFHPRTGKKVEFSSQLPEDLQKILEYPRFE